MWLRRALDLVYALVNESNIKTLTHELLDYLKVADTEFKADLTAKVCLLVQRFAPDKRWHFDSLLQVRLARRSFAHLLFLACPPPALPVDSSSAGAAAGPMPFRPCLMAAPGIPEDFNSAESSWRCSRLLAVAACLCIKACKSFSLNLQLPGLMPHAWGCRSWCKLERMSKRMWCVR